MEIVLKPCKVILERIDVTQYRNTPDSNVAQNIIIQENERSEVVEMHDVWSGNSAMEIDAIGEEDEDITAAALVIFASSYFITKDSRYEKNLTHKRKARSIWSREWLTKRNTDGAYAKLLNEL